MSSRKHPRAIVASLVAGARRNLEPLGSAAALSFPVAAIYAPIGIIVQAPGNATIYGGSPALWVLASAIGMVSLFLVFIAARAWTSRHGDPGPPAVLGWYALATVAQGLTFAFTSVLLGAADSPELTFRLSGLFLQIPLLSIVGYAVTRYDAHRRVIDELEQTRERLLAIGEDLDAELDRAEADLASSVREALDPAVATLEGTLSGVEGGGDKARAMEALESLVEERVRPLVTDLTSEGAPVEAIEAEPRRRGRVPLPPRFTLGGAIRPVLTALLLAVVAIPSAARVLGPGEAILYLSVFCGCVWALLALSRLGLGSARLQTVLGLPLVTFLYVGAGSLSFWLVRAIGVARPEGIAWSVVAVFASIGFVFTTFLLVEARRTRSEGELEAETLRLDHTVGLIRRRKRLVNRRLAFVLHGTLQGALNAAALRIAEAGHVTSQLGQEIRDDIRAALLEIEGRPDAGGGPESGAPLRTSTTIDEISSVWGFRRRFSGRIRPSAEVGLSGDPEVDEAVAEVIREAVNNAFRHGAAVTVEVEVTKVKRHTPKDSEEIAITVRDDGSGPTGSDQPGFGSSLFDDLCRTWTLETEDLWTVFRARVTLNHWRESGGPIDNPGPVAEAPAASTAPAPRPN